MGLGVALTDHYNFIITRVVYGRTDFGAHKSSKNILSERKTITCEETTNDADRIKSLWAGFDEIDPKGFL